MLVLAASFAVVRSKVPAVLPLIAVVVRVAALLPAPASLRLLLAPVSVALASPFKPRALRLHTP